MGGVGYVFHSRRKNDSPNDIRYKLAQEATAIVTDDYPTFIARTHNPGFRPKWILHAMLWTQAASFR